MTRMVSQILWEHCMGELGYWGNDYENDTFVVRSYSWVDEDANDWHFWHKPSGLKIRWYKYPLRGFEANMEITDDQFLDVLCDCTNSMEDGKEVRVLHDIRRWWADRKTEPTISKMEQVDKDINVRSKGEPQTDDIGDCNICKYVGLEHRCNQCVNGSMFCKVEDEPQRDCFLCKWLGDVDVCGRCRNRNLFPTADTPQTDCDHRCVQTEVGCEKTDCAWK